MTLPISHFCVFDFSTVINHKPSQASWSSTQHHCLLLSLPYILTISCQFPADKMSNEAMLSSVSYLDAVRTNANTTVSRVGNVDVFSIEENGEEKEIGLCHIPLLGLFTLPPGLVAPFRVPFNRFESNQELLTVLIALKHLNTGDGSVVPEVEGLNERCNIRFTTEAFDTYFSPNVAVSHALGTLNRQQPGQPPAQLPSPCYFLGAQSSSSSIALSIVSSTFGIPVFSPLSASNALDSKEQHPLFGRLSPSSANQVFAIMRFLKEVWDVKHIGVIHMNNDYGISVRFLFKTKVCMDYQSFGCSSQFGAVFFY